MKLDYRAQVNVIHDMHRPMSASANQPMELAQAVRIALRKYRVGQTPAILGKNLKLIGVDSILAVRELNDFPDDE